MSKAAQPVVLLLVGVMLAVTAASWSAATPLTRFVIHWGVSGAADGFAGREALLILPGIALLVGGLMWLAVRFDPRRANIVRSGGAVDALVVALALLLLAVQVAIAASGAGIALPMERLAPIVGGAFFALIGAVLPHIRQNYTIGVRLPWTIESEAAWDAAHHLAGHLWVATGVAVLTLGVLVGGALPIVVLLIGLFGSIVAAAILAYRVWRREQR